MKKVKALVLFSGGLDSILAAKILQAQGIEVVGLCFSSNFYNAQKAIESAENLGIKLIIEDISVDMLELVKNPPHGYGRNMNPCIDCHAMMIQKAGETARAKSFDFIATGEVLGQRPFSQNREALGKVQELAGTEILRPLCAKLLPETEIEKSGLVIRGKLKDIQGRTRERQFELAKKYKIESFPSPSGGCLLTDPGFSERLIAILDKWSDVHKNDIELLKYGRIFWLKRKNNNFVLLVIGRNHEDNENLKKLAKRGDIMVELKEENGPTSIIRSRDEIDFSDQELELFIKNDLKKSSLGLNQEKSDDEIINISAALTGHYAVKARSKKEIFKIIKI